MANFNRIILIGNLTRDPEYKQLPSGQALCRLGLASNRQFKNKQSGSMVQEVCFIDVDVWGAQAETCNQYLQKGRPVLIEGRLKYDTWQDPQGQTRSKHSIVADRVVFMGSGAGAEAPQTETEESSVMPARPTTVSAPLEKEIMDQIEAIKNRPKAKAAKASQPQDGMGADAIGGIEFKEEPAFKDDLPF